MNNVEEVIQFIIARSFAYIKVELMMSILTINLLLHLFQFIWLLLICLAHLVSLNIASVTYVLSIADRWIYVPRGKSDVDSLFIASVQDMSNRGVIRSSVLDYPILGHRHHSSHNEGQALIKPKAFSRSNKSGRALSGLSSDDGLRREIFWTVGELGQLQQVN